MNLYIIKCKQQRKDGSTCFRLWFKWLTILDHLHNFCYPIACYLGLKGLCFTLCLLTSLLCRYIPVDDLFNIYIDLYNGNYTHMPRAIVQECSQTLFVARYFVLHGPPQSPFSNIVFTNIRLYYTINETHRCTAMINLHMQPLCKNHADSWGHTLLTT